MLDSLTADSIFAEIAMDETSRKAFLLVEGPDESSIFFGHVSADVALIICGGKKNVLGAVSLAESHGYNVYGLVDSDFDRIQMPDKQYPNRVVATSAYDFISDLVMSSPNVLRRALSAQEAPSVHDIELVSGFPIDHLVFAMTTKLAATRLAAKRENYPFSFKGFNFAPLVGETYDHSDLRSFLEHAASRNPKFTVDDTAYQAVQSAFSEVSASRHNSGGHDIVGASVALLRKAGAQASIKNISGTLISVATCQVMASLACLVDLTSMARNESGVELLECHVAQLANV